MDRSLDRNHFSTENPLKVYLKDTFYPSRYNMPIVGGIWAARNITRNENERYQQIKRRVLPIMEGMKTTLTVATIVSAYYFPPAILANLLVYFFTSREVKKIAEGRWAGGRRWVERLSERTL